MFKDVIAECGCMHIKVYDHAVQLMSDPPQRPWICRICGVRGSESIVVDDSNDYNDLLRKFHGHD